MEDRLLAVIHGKQARNWPHPNRVLGLLCSPLAMVEHLRYTEFEVTFGAFRASKDQHSAGAACLRDG